MLNIKNNHRNRVERAQGALLGLLVGDALGSQVEFMQPEHINLLFPNGVQEMNASGVWGTLPGQITDDGEMALALARTLKNYGFYVSKIKKAYQDWGDSNPFDMGNTTRKGLYGTPSKSSKSNGSLMRCAPMGIYTAGKSPMFVIFRAMQDASITHNNPVPVQLTALFVLMISMLIEGNREEIPNTLRSVVDSLNCGEEVREFVWHYGEPADFSSPMGYVGLSFQNAVYHLVNKTNYKDAIMQTVAEGGDTDTNAAICGALLGAAWGYHAIPRKWYRTVINCAPGGKHPRPASYWAQDVLDLAKDLLPHD